MHEMGIASSILEAVGRELRGYPGCRATKVLVRIGAFAGLDPESLRFCFGAIVKDTAFDPLELAIENASGDELDLASLELDEPDGHAAQAALPEFPSPEEAFCGVGPRPAPFPTDQRSATQ